MKTVQALGWYFPESTGGTEAYVRGLVRGLKTHGVTSIVAAPIQGAEVRNETWAGAPVHRYAEPGPDSRAVLRGDRPPEGFEDFRRWLGAQDAEVYHQHSVTTGCGLYHLRAAQALGLATVLTVHVPGPVCPRGTMLFEGREACTRALEPAECGRCALLSRGAGLALSRGLSRIPPGLGDLCLPFGRLGTALGTTALVRRNRERLLALAEASDRVVAVSQWLHEALLRNGVPGLKLVLNRQGVERSGPTRPREPGAEDRPLVVGFLGRWDLVKGLPILAAAVRGLPPEIPIELRAHAANADQDRKGALQQEVADLARGDARIAILPPLPPDGVNAFLRAIDVLAVPSQGLETGPLVVLEALAAGTPVLGSRLGGIAERVRDGVDGLLVPHADVEAWQAAILRLREPGLLARLRAGIGPVRTEAEVARETAALYQEILAARAASKTS